MKNITALAVLVITGFCARPVSALENYALSISPRFGFLYGTADEIVYPPRPDYPAKGDGDYLSLLVWDIKPAFYYGLDLDFARKDLMKAPGFFSLLSLKNAIPGKSGKMEDFDWMSKPDNALTHYSIHDNFSEEIFWLDFAAGISIPLRQFFLLKPYLSFSYMRFVFSGRDGYGNYAQYICKGNYFPISDSPDVVIYTDRVISYTQHWFVLSPGVSASYGFLNRFDLELFFGITPAVLCVDLDVHIGRALVFNDYLFGGLYLEPRAILSFSANQWLSLSMEASYRYIVKTRGAAYKRSVNKSPDGTPGYFLPAGEAGAGLSILDASIAVKIRL